MRVLLLRRHYLQYVFGPAISIGEGMYICFIDDAVGMNLGHHFEEFFPQFTTVDIKFERFLRGKIE